MNRRRPINNLTIAAALILFVPDMSALTRPVDENPIILPFVISSIDIYHELTLPPTRKMNSNTRAPKWDHAVNADGSPADICQAVKTRVTYKRDADDEWQDPATTWKRQSGDCEDFAFCVEALCKETGIDSSVYIIKEKDSLLSAHAVVIGSYHGRMWMSSNGDYREVSSFEDVKTIIARQLRFNLGSISIEEAETIRAMRSRNGRSSWVETPDWVDETEQWIDEIPQWVDAPKWSNPLTREP